MPSDTKLLTFTANTSTGDQDLTGTSFTPKAAIVWADGVNNSADTFSNAYTFCYGFTDGTNSRVCACISEDNQASSDTARSVRDDSLIWNFSETDTASTRDRATFVQWLSNGMRINWATAPGSAFKFHVLFLGGSDLTDVAVGTFAPNITGAGSYSHTALSFQPDFLQIIHTTDLSSNLNSLNGSGVFGIGSATSSSSQHSVVITTEDNRTTMDTWQYQDDTKIISSQSTTTGTFFDSGSLVSFNSDGFTISFTKSWGGTYAFPFIALKGGEYSTGKITEPGSTGNQTTTTNTDVKAVQIFGIGTSTIDSSSSSNSFLSVGAGTSSTERVVAYIGDSDNTANSECVSRYESSSIYLMATPAATASSSTIDEEADLNAVASDGFTLNWSNVGGGLPLYYVTFGGDVSSTLFERDISESAISISDPLTRLYSGFRSSAESAISVNDPVTRLYSGFRTQSESAISVNDPLTRIYSGFRDLDESAISCDDTSSRFYLGVRSPSDTIGVSDQIARLQSLFRSLSDTVNVSDDVTGVELSAIVLTEAAINVSDDLQRLTALTRSLSDTVGVSEDFLSSFIAHRTQSEPAISVNDQLDESQTFAIGLSDTVGVSDDLQRLQSLLRSLSDTVGVSEQLARIYFGYRSLSESGVDVSEQLERIGLLLRSLSESAISVDDSLDTQMAYFRSLSDNISVNDPVTRIFYGFRTLAESAIDVSEQVERIKTQLRSISETAIDVDDSVNTELDYFRTLSDTVVVTDDVDTLKAQMRTITETAITVSEQLTRVLLALRPISDTVSASDQIARLTAQFRALSEAAINVSDDLDFDATTKLAFNEVIAVSEQLTRSLDAFRSLADTISVSDFGSDGNTIIPQLAEFLSDPGYMNPLRTRIRFRSRTNPTLIYYNYDSFGASARPFNILACSVRLAQGEVGSFTIDIEDSDETVNKDQIGFGTKVTVEVKKEIRHDYIPLCTGFVRRIRKIRSATGVLIWRVTGYSTQIVFNERVVNFRRAAKREQVDSPIPLLTDERMLAYRLAIDLITSTDILPLRKPTVQNSGGYQSLAGISDRVDDFIAQIAPGLTDATTVMNALAELTGAIWGTDENGEPYFRYPHAVHSGIIITDNPQDTDPATITSTNVDQFEYEDSIDQSEGFANRLYVLNAVDTKSTASSSSALGSTTLTIRGVAQQFTSTDNNVTGAAFILSKVGTPVPYDNSNVITGYLRADFNNFPTGATLATFEIPIDQITNAQETIFVNDIKTETGTINPGQKYWWVLIGRFNDESNTVRWHHNNIQNNTSQPFSARLPLVDADPTQPGQQLNWQRNPAGPVYAFSTFSSVRHVITQSDADSIARYGLIEGIVDLPAFEDDDTFSKALVKILDTSAKPKRVYDYARVTIPTDKIFVPGQLVTVIDSKAKLTSEKNVTAEISECTYQFDTKQNALGVKYVDIRLIGFIDETLDDYLDTTPCT